MEELTKKQVAAIKAVGKACNTTEYRRPLIKYVFSDGAKIYGTNAHILFMERDVGAPEGAYLPKSAERIDQKILFLCEDLDYFLKSLLRCEKESTAESETRAAFYRAKYAFDAGYKKELYQITFATEDGHFQREAFFLRSQIKKAVAFVGKDFKIYQNEPKGMCVFERDDGKRLAIVMEMSRTQNIKILNDVDLKG